MRQTNEIVHSLIRVALCRANFCNFIRILSCISTLILNQMH